MDSGVTRPCAGFPHMIEAQRISVYGTLRTRGADGRFSSKAGIWCDVHRVDPSPIFKVIDDGELQDLVKQNNL